MNRRLLSVMVFSACVVGGCAQPPRSAEPQKKTAPAAAEERALGQSGVVIAPEPVQQAPAPMASSEAGMRFMQESALSRAESRVMPGESPPLANTENYAAIKDNVIHRAAEQPVSTFSIDVDTGSYANVRRMLNWGQLPPADAVRAEEFINYFDYGYPVPTTRDVPFSVTTEVAPAPWNSQRHLLLVGLKGYEVPKSEIPAANIVYLIDSSGSMQSEDKIELLKQGFRAMTEQLRPQDRVAIVAYAGSAGLVLPSTTGNDKTAIIAALDRIEAGGSTNGGEGIELAYAVAKQNFIERGVNRVILASDGDFNVGNVSVDALTTLVGTKRKSGIGLTVLGFGGGNLNDHLAEQLANKGNGNYFYIDTAHEGRKVLVDQLAATVLTIAQDVKVQIEFNPAVVEEYRLIGYENRVLAREDFNNDNVDAGEIGAGHNVTALYEISLEGSGGAASDPLRYGGESAAVGDGNELAFLKLRYKAPGESVSRLIQQPIDATDMASTPSERLRFAAAIAAFADALRGGTHLNGWGFAEVRELAEQVTGEHDDRREFVQLLERASSLSGSGVDIAAGGQ